MKWAIIEIFSGALLFIISYFLAVYFMYSRFYTILLFGLFFILKGAYSLKKKRELLTLREFLVLYFPFFVMLGIFFDLIIGLWITKLWYYPEYTLLNYINLYLVIYPLGAFVMLYSFALLESIFIHRPRGNRLAYEHSLTLSLAIFVTGFIAFIISLIFLNRFNGFFAMTFLALSFIGLLDYLTLRIKKNNLLERLHIKTFKYILLILSIAYIQGIIHEWPNLFAREWIYKNWPLQEITFLGIPVVILFFGWIFLLIGSYTFFELIIAILRKRDPHR